MRLIGAGLPRTATSTQLVAFEQLGFGPCYHMRELMANPDVELAKWERVVAGTGDWDEIVGGYQSTADWPAARYYRELAERYPDAKVVLSVRSGESWVRSMRETVWGMYYGESVLHHVSAARGLVDRNWARFIALMNHMTWDEGTGGIAGDTADDAALAAIMERWNDEVKASIPADRLLVWEPADGWGPLCEFLEVAVPDEPLPHINDTAAFAETMIGRGLSALRGWWTAQREQDRTSAGVVGSQ